VVHIYLADGQDQVLRGMGHCPEAVKGEPTIQLRKDLLSGAAFPLEEKQRRRQEAAAHFRQAAHGARSLQNKKPPSPAEPDRRRLLFGHVEEVHGLCAQANSENHHLCMGCTATKPLTGAGQAGGHPVVCDLQGGTCVERGCACEE
jgi:hypothetical protein